MPTQVEVLLTGDQALDTAATIEALQRANTPPVLFVAQGKLVRIVPGEAGPAVQEVTEDLLLAELARVARFVREGEDDLPATSVNALVGPLLARGMWPFPPLWGVTDTPIIRAKGSVEERPGYDAESGIYYLPPTYPEHPTPEQLAGARAFVWQFFSEFPYASQEDAALAFGVLLSVVTRGLYDISPLVLVDGNHAACGKTLWVQALSTIVLGSPIMSTATPTSEAGWAKALTAHLMGENGFQKVCSFFAPDEDEGLVWETFLSVWRAKIGEGVYYTTGELVGAIKADPELSQALPEPFVTMFSEESEKFSMRLSHALVKRREMPYGRNNLRIRRINKGQRPMWAVISTTLNDQFSSFAVGNPLLSFDDVRVPLRSPHLASFLCSPVRTVRFPGAQWPLSVTQRTLTVVNGNNVQVDSDLARRSVRIRLDAGLASWKRTDFAIELLQREVRQNRSLILAALMTLVQGWRKAGEPHPAHMQRLVGFEVWSEVIGGILAFAGIDGFLRESESMIE